MLRQCVHPDQKDWVTKLPAIEFAINSARSESTGFAPFFLNFGRMPRSMLWTSTLSTEFPSVRTFALQKKLAIMAAHDSILSARVKQTRDANRKRRAAPFKTGELVYLSTKNISFAKGLARKLIPKFMGPYKILRDFDNSSFKLELPSHLKQRGVHDVFHSSLLCEHIPNDDRLFPGRMDTQIGTGPETEGEWAVDRILSHAGSKTDSHFEIRWKTGDITWLPYYQIAHLQALDDYLDLLGGTGISNLPRGKGLPPQDDPQVALGAVSFSFSFSPIPIPPTPNRHSLKDRLKNIQPPFTPSSPTHSQPERPITFIDTTLNLELDMPDRRALPLLGVNHPNFTRISPTNYLMQDPDHSIDALIHVGQLAEYIKFDEQLRRRGSLTGFRSMPIGFSDFCVAWNNGTALDDPRRFCEVFLYGKPEDHVVNLSDDPIHLSEFHVTPEQTGLQVENSNQPPAALQADINQEFAALMVAKQKRQRQYYEDRQEKKLHTYDPYEAPEHSRMTSRMKKRPRRSHRSPGLQLTAPLDPKSIGGDPVPTIAEGSSTSAALTHPTALMETAE